MWFIDCSCTLYMYVDYCCYVVFHRLPVPQQNLGTIFLKSAQEVMHVHMTTLIGSQVLWFHCMNIQHVVFAYTQIELWMECVIFASMFTGGNFECSILCQPSKCCSSSHRKFVSLYLLNYTDAIHTCTSIDVGMCVECGNMCGIVDVCVGGCSCVCGVCVGVGEGV